MFTFFPITYFRPSGNSILPLPFTQSPSMHPAKASKAKSKTTIKNAENVFKTILPVFPIHTLGEFIMYRGLLSRLLCLVIITPLVVIALRKREKSNIRYVLLFAAFFLIGSLIRGLPFYFESINFSKHAMWNWSGKFYAMLISILFVLFYRKCVFNSCQNLKMQNRKFVYFFTRLSHWQFNLHPQRVECTLKFTYM